MKLRQALAPVCAAAMLSGGSAAAAVRHATADPQPVQNFIVDPGDTSARVGATDAVTVVRSLDPRAGLYQIEIENTSDIGYINTFNWVPPAGMTITAVTSSEGGRCRLTNGIIGCTGGKKGIAPPICTCRTGGKLTVNFRATGNGPTWNGQWWTYYGIVGGYTQITSMTPVPYHIPSFLSPSVGADVPLCAKGQVSTTAKPCALA
jgi:hypothetical protein